VLDRQSGRAVQPGDDLVLTLDPALERTAEQLLDETLRRRRLVDADDSSAGGAAAIVLDVRTGAVYCAASAPRFDPNLLGSHAADLLDNPAKPLFDRATKMAIPPGSVFKLVTAAALLEHEGFDADEAYLCRGYLRDPDHLRCMLYRRQGIGHGEATLVDALAQSCNTYFFHQAERLGAPAIFEWSRRFALGVPTGIDLPDEAAGQVADPVGRSAAGQTRWSLADTQALAIGQSTLAVTPLQMARAMAAVANGGRLVTPRVVRSVGLVTDADDGTSPAPASSDAPALGLSDRSLAVLREGLERVVADERGTGHRTVFLPEVMIAGKTGTAETGTGRADHAWFVGYAPADRPCVALAIVIEHGGSGAEIAGPVAKRLVQKLADLGYFTPGRSLAVTGTSDISKP
jgi:penicillin-binding protein 2